MAPRPALALSFALAVAAGAGRAAADTPPAVDKALGTALFDAGRALLAEGKVDEACAKLEQSYAIEAALGTLLNLAVCHDKQGRTATAWAELTKARDLAAAAGQAPRAKFAAEQAKALEARLSRLTVVAPPGAPPGIVVRLDGRELGAAVLGTPMPLDPGEHAIEVAAAGKRAFATRVRLAPGPSAATVEVPALADAARAAAPVAAPPAAAPAPARRDAPARSAPRLWGGVALGVAGLAGVVVGSVFGARTLSKKSEIGGHCAPDGACDDVGFSLQEDAHATATVSTVAFVVGGVALAGGVVLVATSSTGAAPRRAWIAPAPGGASLGAAF